MANFYEKKWLKSKKNSWADFRYLINKGYFPYEHLINPDVFDEESLPPLDAFKSRLKNTNITQSQYRKAQTMWNKFEVQVKL